MQKVIIVSVFANYRNESDKTLNFDFPELNAALADGYRVRQVHQIAPHQGASIVVLTFILEK